MSRCPHCPHCAAIPVIPVALRAPKVPAVGSRGHVKCVAHVPITSIAFSSPVLCFDARPSAAELKARYAFVAHLEKVTAAHAAREKARPTGDGLIAGEDGKRIRPRRLAAWNEARKPHLRTVIRCADKPSRKPVAAGPWPSKFTGPRGKWRKGRARKVAA